MQDHFQGRRHRSSVATHLGLHQPVAAQAANSPVAQPCAVKQEPVAAAANASEPVQMPKAPDVDGAHGSRLTETAGPVSQLRARSPEPKVRGSPSSRSAGGDGRRPHARQPSQVWRSPSPVAGRRYRDPHDVPRSPPVKRKRSPSRSPRPSSRHSSPAVSSDGQRSHRHYSHTRRSPSSSHRKHSSRRKQRCSRSPRSFDRRRSRSTGSRRRGSPSPSAGHDRRSTRHERSRSPSRRHV